MNSSLAPNSMLVIPALICLLGIGAGIVAAFWKRDARIPLSIGGVAFFVLYFLSRPRWVQTPRSASSPIVYLPTGSTTTPHETFATWGILLLLLVVLIGVAAVVAAIRHKRVGTLLAVSAVILAASFVVGFSATKIRVQQTTVVSSSPLPQLQPAENSVGPERPLAGTDRLANVPSGPTPTRIEYIVGSGPALIVPELPAWRRNPPRAGSTEQGWSKYVLSSQQFATVEEAEAELFQSITTDVQAGFTYHWPETQGWVPTRDDIVSSGLITEKVIETLPLKVGEFENPVYRVSWLVEFRPEANKALHARWFPLEAERRSRWILAGLAGITGLLGGTAMILRRQRPARDSELALSTASPTD